MATVVLVGTLDTKGLEYGFLRERLQEAGCDVTLVDAGVLGAPSITPDISRDEVASAAGASLADLVSGHDRGKAIAAMANGATAIVIRLHAEGKLHGVMGLGGSGGSSLVTQAMRALPVGVPKLMVSTVASGDTRPYVGAVDITMMYSVVDIAGINRISSRIMENAAGAMAGMATAYANPSPITFDRPLIGASMFGVTTPAVDHARESLEAQGYEVVVFHATGAGGMSLEALIAGGFFAGVLDITTTELADELVGGVLSAGPNRLEAAGAAGIPQVVAPGALDMVNFGPLDTVPPQFRDRNLYVHNPTVTLMRTTPEECAELGRQVAEKLNAATGPVALFIPRKGVSAIAAEGEVFHDPAADTALFDALLTTIGDHVEVHDLDLAINDPAFAEAMVSRLAEMIAEHQSQA
jgi:uncharacterized protein (UPF0261 family)